MKIQTELTAESCFFFALLCLTLPLKWIAAIIFAGSFHELCHALAVLLTGGEIYSIRIGLSGTVMDVSEMCPWKELLCTLSGPAGSMTLFLLAEHIPHTAICALFHGVYNLLPIYPLDGGRAICCILKLCYPHEKAVRVCRMLNRVVGVLLALCGILVIVRLKIGILPVLTAMLFLSRAMDEKYLAKMAFSGYNRITL